MNLVHSAYTTVCSVFSSMLGITSPAGIPVAKPVPDAESLRRTEKVFAERVKYEAGYRHSVSTAVSSPHLIPDLADLVTSYLPRADVFGWDAWKTFFGVDVGAEPSLPKDIDHILQSPSHLDPTQPCKTIADDFMLVLIPKEFIVGGKKVPLSLNSLGKLVQNLKTQAPTKYDYFWKDAQDQYGDVSNHDSHWVLMSRDVLPKSRNKSYADQKTQVAIFSEQTRIPYEVPTLLEAATCIFAEYARTGIRLYGNEPWTYTRCQEKIRDWQLVVGGFAPGGLSVDRGYDAGADFLGVAVLRKFLLKAIGT